MSSHQSKPVLSTMEYLDKLQKDAPEGCLGSLKRPPCTSGIRRSTSPRRSDLEEKYSKDGIEILLHPADVQYGHLSCNVKKFPGIPGLALLAKPNRFTFFGGDMIDAATAMSVASPYENTDEPEEQIYRFCELAMPMRHRVLGFVGGNHERRGAKTFGDLGAPHCHASSNPLLVW